MIPRMVKEFSIVLMYKKARKTSWMKEMAESR